MLVIFNKINMRIFLHNPKCSKSREALKVLSNSGKSFTLRNYVQWPLSYDELEDLQEKLWLKAIDFTRTNEKEFKENNLTKDSSDKDILKAISKHPKLMQRPIVYDENKAIVCRPPEDVLKIFKK